MPNPKPTNVKLMQGTARPGRLPRNEARPGPLRTLCPDWLPEPGKRLWRYLKPRLSRLNLLTEVDLPAFEAMCMHYAVMREAATVIRQEGVAIEDPDHKKATRKHPMLQILRDNSDAFRSYAVLFGLDPASRGRINVPVDDTEDEFTQFLKKKMGHGG